MGHFYVRTRLTGPTGLTEEVDLFVDTGSTLIVLPHAIAERLDLQPVGSYPVELAGGAQDAWPVADVRIALEGREAPTLCFVADHGEPLLGVVALESLFLAVDPVGRRLVPTKAFAMPSTSRPAVAVPA